MIDIITNARKKTLVYISDIIPKNRNVTMY